MEKSPFETFSPPDPADGISDHAMQQIGRPPRLTMTVRGHQTPSWLSWARTGTASFHVVFDLWDILEPVAWKVKQQPPRRPNHDFWNACNETRAGIVSYCRLRSQKRT